MNISLKDTVLVDIEKNKYFLCDGCACGDFVYQLSEHLWMNVYRSCRKSSMTPKEKLWHLHEICFYDNVYFDSSNEISEFGNVIETAKLNPADETRLYHILKEKTKEHWKNEYRNEDIF